MAMKPDKSNFQYVDRPDLTVAYANSVGLITTEDGVVQLEFLMSRYPPGRHYPVARLAMPMVTVVELYNKLRQLMDTSEKKGVVVVGPSGSTTLQ